MNLKEFLTEEKELRKERKLEKKKAKKSPKTSEEKFIRIASVITGILISFMALFRACSGFSGEGFSWNKIVGISDEMIVAIEAPVDENIMFPTGKIDPVDLDNCIVKLNEANANIFNNEDVKASKSFTLNDRELGAFANNIFKSDKETPIKLDVLSFEIFEKDSDFYEKSIVLLNLSEITEIENLPKVYLTSESKIDILDSQICILKTDLKVNQISDEINEEIVELLNNYSSFKLIEMSNSLINSSLNLFASTIGASVVLIDGGINFKIKG